MKEKFIITAMFLFLALQLTGMAYDRPGIAVHDTEKHGIYVTVGGTKVEFEDDEMPFIDENGRTKVSVSVIAGVLGKKTEWSLKNQAVLISDNDENSETDSIWFTIGERQYRKNGILYDMDTEASVIDGCVFVPVRALGEALDYEVSYTEYDRFEDITVSFKSGMRGFKKTDNITVWGNVQDKFHEGKGLGQIVPYEGEKPDLSANYINEYELTLDISNDGSSRPKTVSVFWDTLYDKAYVADGNALYTVSTDFARFVDSFLENTGLSYEIGNEENQLFRDYGWTLDYKINKINEILPAIKELGEFNPCDYYFAYNNELSKDIGLDMSDFAGKVVTAEIYRINESMPEEFYPIQNARGIVVKCDGKIIGAYISAGRHQAENACSLKRRSFETITEGDFNTWLASRLKEEKDIIAGDPEEIIKRYFKALGEKDEQAAVNCIAKQTMFEELTANMLNDKLYNKAVGLQLENTAFIEYDDKSVDNIKTIKSVEIKPVTSEENSETVKTYGVSFDVEYEREGTISSEGQCWICSVVYESEQTGWKISSFGH